MDPIHWMTLQSWDQLTLRKSALNLPGSNLPGTPLDGIQNIYNRVPSIHQTTYLHRSLRIRTPETRKLVFFLLYGGMSFTGHILIPKTVPSPSSSQMKTTKGLTWAMVV